MNQENFFTTSGYVSIVINHMNRYILRGSIKIFFFTTSSGNISFVRNKISQLTTLSSKTPLTVQFARVIKFQSQSCVKQQFSLTSGVFTSFPKQSFMTF